MKVYFVVVLLVFTGVLLAKDPASPHPVKMVPTEAQKAFYKNKVHPILEDKCLRCHGQEGKKVKGELYLTSRAGLLRGGEVGPSLSVTKPENSFLLQMISYKDEDHEMPPKSKLPAESIAILTEWIKMGAPFDPAFEKKLPDHHAKDDPTAVTEKTKNYWAFKKPVKTVVPKLAKHPVDAFILEKLQKAGLKPNSPASKRVLIRRAYYDLIGLPPSPSEVEAFINDKSPDAYGKLLDKLLASPQYGEKWGRHWLDLVRFAESNGYERDSLKSEAYRYRDYVIKSFNEDKPYTTFLKEQLAGDELDNVSADSMAATGYYRLGVWDDEPADRELHKYEVLDGIVSTTSNVFMGMTVGCARCHDHKIDPIPQADYYSMLAFFHDITSIGKGNSNLREVTVAPTVKEKLEQDRRAARQKSLEARLISLENEFKTQLIKRKPSSVPASMRAGFGKKSQAPSSDIKKILADSRKEAKTWKYTFKKPKGNWIANDYKDAGWKSGKAGFGRKGTPGSVVRTNWSGKEIWMRREIQLDQVPTSGKLVIHHDEDATVYVNGNVVHQLKGFTSKYKVIDLDKGEIKVFQTGKNVIAVHCKQTVGGQYIDVGFEVTSTGTDLLGLMKKHGKEILGEAKLKEYMQAGTELKKLKSVSFAKAGSKYKVMAVAERGNTPVHVLRRGNPRFKGERVTAAFPTVLSPPEAAVEKRKDSSGKRLAFANWLASDDNPTTARVWVNRIWQYHFGRGIVRSASDFGRSGNRPTHPKLLDWLAVSFMEGGWKMKKFHKFLMMSKTYQMSSEGNPTNFTKDPANDLFWQFNMRRLTSEEIRDSVINLTGKLNLKVYGKSYYSDIPAEALASSSTKGGKWGKSSVEERNRRSIYILTRRSLLDPMLNVHDSADTDSSTAERFVTTVPAQSLAMLNSAFVNEKADLFAQRLKAEVSTLKEQINLAFKLALSRLPNDAEVNLMTQLVESITQAGNKDKALARACLLIMNLNEFIYLD